ncbi:MAG: polysaccharide deacetylase family protein [Candidatus Peribacteraceae bacterium]|jgi:polysaccharide deacetylase family protein (PEP-CTERM system associated)|nr:polysaccharide deacetylase family protein [Candidatus Peribacteraceae bacterium]|tara:strand:- start:160 stop:1011 length:852 start_codon:yes stop_codon:yes gene_type:complete
MYILSFDIEEWFHLLDHPSTRYEKHWAKFESRIDANLERILNLLESSNTQATFFCLGWIAENYPYIIKKISQRGYQIACHSHRHQLAYEQKKNEFRNDLLDAKYAIEDVSGVKLDTYRIPGFSLTDQNLWVLDVLSEEGFKVDCSVFPANRGHGGLPSFKSEGPSLIELKNGSTLKELPLNTYPVLGNRMVFSGGGYFRLLPYPILKKMFKKSEYVMTYFHPRDFDPDQPVIKDLSFIRKFKSYYGLNSAKSKLEKLLSDFDFVDVQTAVGSIDWSATPKVSI